MAYVAKSFYHPVAKSYFDKIEGVGGSVLDKNSINNFVSQLSRFFDPKLWVCWPLLSSQNIGTGTAIYPLGQFPTTNGTLVNGATWGTDGIQVLNSNSSYVGLPANSVPWENQYSILAIFEAAFQSSTTFLYKGFFDGGSVNNWHVWDAFSSNEHVYDHGTPDGANTARAQTFNAITQRVLLDRWNGIYSGKINDVNVTYGGSFTGPQSQDSPVYLGSSFYGTSYPNAKYQFFLTINQYISDEVYLKIYNIYKQTLGRGLNLP